MPLLIFLVLSLDTNSNKSPCSPEPRPHRPGAWSADRTKTNECSLWSIDQQMGPWQPECCSVSGHSALSFCLTYWQGAPPPKLRLIIDHPLTGGGGETLLSVFWCWCDRMTLTVTKCVCSVFDVRQLCEINLLWFLQIIKEKCLFLQNALEWAFKSQQPVFSSQSCFLQQFNSDSISWKIKLS